MRLSVLSTALLLSVSTLMANQYKAYFCSKGTGPTNVVIEALNDTGAREQVKARYPGAYSIVVVQLPSR
jgi:hypothetical protein